jgi:hypothetical protein
MSINDLGEKIKAFGKTAKEGLNPEEISAKYYTALIILLVGFSSFGLGRLSVINENREPIIVEENGAEILSTDSSDVSAGKVTAQTASVAQSSPVALTPGGKVVASKNGTKYYFPWCGGVSKIAETNKVWFNSEAEAKAKGYTPAANCKGLK